ncbi:type II toxin-antitoxin system HicA family toxin [Polaromonas sp. CG_23.6]|uniref:type II toxin-antitoxin system HicA family toxin n=1 Tax=Polaromonas sp. CG_23.6 TaxID=2760709 RepID=UPI002476771C|nr:type II toxin-antitoxin system HicA family toxin [Polaromonas sp. CG_23.6]
MKRKHQRTQELIFSRPVCANARWTDIEAVLRKLGREFEEREGSRVEVFLFGLVRVFHRPLPSPPTDKGAAAAICKWREWWCRLLCR